MSSCAQLAAGGGLGELLEAVALPAMAGPNLALRAAGAALVAAAAARRMLPGGAAGAARVAAGAFGLEAAGPWEGSADCGEREDGGGDGEGGGGPHLGLLCELLVALLAAPSEQARRCAAV